jgi:Stage II sporulation protein/Putative Ig domain
MAEPAMSEPSVLPPEGLRQFDPATAANADATVRVPRNIRVLGADGVTIDYVSLESYCRRVLPAEWIASWAAYPGGNHALNAGAVTVRTYAVGAINKPKTSTYDICGTTACQVYGPTTSTYTDVAVNETASFVMVPDGGTIPAALTEYSAENNSLGFDCGDTFTAPASGCLYDPVCAGETRNGHGRGLCQWGSAKWATGLKFPGNSTRDHVSVNGFPPRDWTWILEHYYPALQLVKGAPLILGDEVTARTTLNVRACSGGGIGNGINCPALAAESAGATGVIVGGPVQITSDGAGYTWFQIRWANVTGWSVENYLERTVLPPNPPIGLTASGASTDRIDLAWTDTSDVETGFKIERAPGMAGPWSEIAVTGANTTNYSDSNLFPSSSWFYRVGAFNSAGDSTVSNPIGATTLGESPALLPIPDQIVTEGTTLIVPARATAPDFIHVITDFENYPSLTANGEVLFREPRFSSTTSAFLAGTPNLAVISDVFPPGPNTGRRTLQISCAFVQATGSWLRLTTAGAPAFPNPVIDLTAGLRFDVWADKPVGVALGVRETSTAAGSALGSDGGTNGPVQWVGVTGVLSGQPQPSRTVPASTWTTCAFSFPTEPVRSLAGDESRLDSASRLGVLEHLVLVPLGGPGIYNVYLDNVAVMTPKTLACSLAPGAPAGASIDSTSGTITWTPSGQDAGRSYFITVRATDNAQPSLMASRTFQVTVVMRPSLQVTLSGSEVILSWLASKDVNYRVQVKGNLADPVWSDLTTNFTAAGAVASFTDKLGATQRFYRVVIAN